MDLDFFDIGDYQNGMSNLRIARELTGLKQQELADLAGTSQPQIARLEGSKRKLSKEWAEKLAPILKTTPQALMFGNDNSEDVYQKTPLSNDAKSLENGGFYRPPPSFMDSVDNMPLYASAEGGEGTIIVSTDELGRVQRPSSLIGVQGAYAILIVGESMIPAYEPGDRSWVNPSMGPKGDTDVILYAGSHDTEMRATIKRLVSYTDKEWTLKQHNPPRVFKLDRGIWHTHHRVVGKFNR